VRFRLHLNDLVRAKVGISAQLFLYLKLLAHACDAHRMLQINLVSEEALIQTKELDLLCLEESFADEAVGERGASFCAFLKEEGDVDCASN
jgi:hypothetical protein